MAEGPDGMSSEKTSVRKPGGTRVWWLMLWGKKASSGPFSYWLWDRVFLLLAVGSGSGINWESKETSKRGCIKWKEKKEE